MNLIIDYQKSSVIIELIDNPLVNNWVKNFRPDEDWKSWRKLQCAIFKEGKDKCRIALIDAIKNFNSILDFKFPFEVADDTEFTRQDLNTIHRYFTTGTSFCSWTLDSEKIIRPDSPLFGVFEVCAKRINEEVHYLENYYNTPGKEQAINVDILSFRLENQEHLDYFQHAPGDWRYLDYNLEYNVFMNYAICGKDYFQAYIDNDDPRKWDITAQFSSYFNNFYIDINGERNKVMASPQFKLWLDNACMYNSAWQFMPIGKVISGEHGPASTFKGFRLE
jgi:hypothetical protein